MAQVILKKLANLIFGKPIIDEAFSDNFIQGNFIATGERKAIAILGKQQSRGFPNPRAGA